MIFLPPSSRTKDSRTNRNKIQRSKVFVQELKSYGSLIRSKTLVNEITN